MITLFGHDFKPPAWELGELSRCFRLLVACVAEGGKLALTVDGLDEFHGDHRSLVTLVKDIAALTNVKMCVSSRPWNVFRDACGN